MSCVGLATHVKRIRCCATLLLATGNWCCDYNDDIRALSGFGAANSESLAQLLTSFFFYWAHQHDFRRSVITIRMSTVLTKAMKGW